MGKKLAIVLVFFLLIGFSIFYNCYIENTFHDLLEDIKPIEQMIQQEDYEQILTVSAKAYDSWKQTEPYFNSLIDHNDMESFNDYFISLISSAQSQDFTETQTNYQLLCSSLEHLIRLNQISLENIL